MIRNSQPSTYKLLVFDFDGTLVDTVDDIAFHANSVLTDFGFERRPVIAVKKAIGKGVHELFLSLAPNFKENKKDLEGAVSLFKKRYRNDPIRKTKPYPFVKKMLAGYLKNTQKAIVTNKPQDITRQILRDLKLDIYFTMTVGMFSDYAPKPDPTATEFVMRKLRALPRQTLFIGDSEIDSMTAYNANISFGWVKYGYGPMPELAPAFKFRNALAWGAIPVLQEKMVC